jgi:hypothetical protein
VNVRNGWRRFRFGTSFIVIAISIGTSSFQTVVASETSHKSQKNQKLASSLVLLSQSVKQEITSSAAAGATKPPAGFSPHTLPKQLRDAIQAGQMRVVSGGGVQVYIEVSAVSLEHLGALRDNGVTIQIVGEPIPDQSRGEVLTKVPTVQGLLPVSMINQVSALPFVRYIRLPDYGLTNTGAVDSEGDAISQATAARSQFGVDGSGIRVGVISGGIGGIFATGCTTCGATTAIPSPINSRDLPLAIGTRDSNGVLVSVSGGITAQSFPASSPDLEGHAKPDGPLGVNSEGSAMLEIVHDLAPGAQLYFANGADGTSLSFEQAVNYLAANTDLVVDDISFPGPSFDGTSDVSTNTATALNTDAYPIRGYFTSVGNLVFNHWGEPWTDSGRTLTLSCPASSGGISETGNVQLFQASANTQDATNLGPRLANFLQLQDGASLTVTLAWNDPSAGSNNDYELFLYLAQNNTLITPLQCSINPQSGTQPPFEVLTYRNDSGATQQVAILVQNLDNAAAPRNLDMFVVGGIGNSKNLNFYTASGSVPAQADAGGSPVSVVSVGAIAQTQCTGAGNCTGTVEPYSSQGPTQATAQSPSRTKPDVITTDDVSVTGAGGFGFNGTAANRTNNCAIGETPCFFPGTSAASPHAAAIAALVLQATSGSVATDPATERANLRNFLTSTATPLSGIHGPIPNNIEGFGLLDALSAVKAALPAPSGAIGLSSNPATINIAISGESGTSTITATGTGGFAGTVNFTCAISPVPANDPPICGVVPSSVTLNATTTSATATLKVSTTAVLGSQLALGNPTNKPDYFAANVELILACVLLLGVFHQKRRWPALFAMALLVLAGVTLSSCASSGNGGTRGSNKINLGTPPGAYTVIVTATSGNTIQTTSVLLNVAQ